MTEPLTLWNQAFGINHDWILKKLEMKIAFYCNSGLDLEIICLKNTLKKSA